MVDEVKDSLAESIDVASEVLEKQQQPETDEVELENGIKITCNAVSIMTLRHSQANIPKPKPPVVVSEEKGREEEWEGDPRYQAELLEWQEKIGNVATNLMLMMGTKIHSIPANIDNPEDDGWVDMLQATGMELNVSSNSARYLSWLRFYAISTPQDLLEVTTKVAQKSGVLNKDAEAALDSFRGGEERTTDLDSEAEELSTDGDILPSSNGRSHLRSGGED